MQTLSLTELNNKAIEVRQNIITSLLNAGSGHTAGPLGMADIFTALYFRVLKHEPSNPNWEDRDRVFLSNGHICPVWYVTLALSGYFPLDELKTLRKFGSKLQGHPSRLDTLGVINSSGPLGQGLSQAIGSALASRLNNKRYEVFCLMSDGEHNEGQVWEAVMFAAKERLNNLTVVIDRNNIQIDGYTEDVMPLDSLKQKYEAFNWYVIEIDGHNIEEFIDACNKAKAVFEKPVCIIAHTIPGKGIGFMEFDSLWHGKPPTEIEAKNSLKELRNLKGKIIYD